MKDTTFFVARLAREEAAEKLRKEKATHVREAREERDRRRRGKRSVEERLARDFSLTRNIDSDDGNNATEKRPFPSPMEEGAPDKKTRHRSTSRTSSQGGGSRGSSPGQH